MRKIIFSIFLTCSLLQPVFAIDCNFFTWSNLHSNDNKAIKKILTTQVKSANKTDFERFISTYDPSYRNSDGFNLDIFSALIKDIWETYEGINYSIDIKDININDNQAEATVIENSYGEINLSKAYEGELKSEAETIYYFRKNEKGKWKIVSDTVLNETTSLLYGAAKGLDIRLTTPASIEENTDYTATLEFEPPKGIIAIASLASDKVQYPQKQTEEVFRAMPEDNILERIFTSNSDNCNEYIVASIGLTRTSVSDLNLRLNLVGFGYTIKRVNVNSAEKGIE